MTDVLIVEPSHDLALIVAESLARKEISTAVAHTAQAGIELADSSQPKVVILELLMHRHNGLEFIYELKSHSDWLNIPIIFYTNLSKDELEISEETEKEINLIGHFYKPTSSLEDLVDCVVSNIQ